MEEHVVLIKEDGTIIGTAKKATVHTGDTPLHKGFSVFLFNERGELLLQQRSDKKITWPLVWSNSCCGHPMQDESNIDAAKRRLLFELGIQSDQLYEILPHYRYTAEKDGVKENEWCPVIVGFYDGKVTPNPDEVASFEWKPWNEFLREIEGQSDYSPWCAEEAILLSKDPVFRRLYERLYGWTLADSNR